MPVIICSAKPRTIQALQVEKNIANFLEIEKFIGSHTKIIRSTDNSIKIKTNSLFWQYAYPKDWIVKEDGRFYIYTDAHFIRHYDISGM